jgi:hypothetical protein
MRVALTEKFGIDYAGSECLDSRRAESCRVDLGHQRRSIGLSHAGVDDCKLSGDRLDREAGEVCSGQLVDLGLGGGLGCVDAVDHFEVG